MSDPRPFIRGEVSGAMQRARWASIRWQYPELLHHPLVRVGARGSWEVLAGSDVSIGPRAVIGADHHVVVRGSFQVGADFYANRWFYLSCFASVTIGDRVRFGERVSVHDENHAMDPDARGQYDRGVYTSRDVRVNDDVWLGAGVVVLPGAVIGRGTVVGAGSVVRGALEADSVYAGVPARRVRGLGGR